MIKIKKSMLVIDKWTCIICLVAGTAILFVNVVARVFLRTGIPWSEEIGRYLMIYMVYFGMSYSQYGNDHLRIDSVLSLYPKKAVPYVKLLSDVLFLAYCVVVTYYSTLHLMRFGMAPRMVTLAIPMIIAYIPIPFGHGMLGIRLLITVIERIQALIQQVEYNPVPVELRSAVNVGGHDK